MLTSSVRALFNVSHIAAGFVAVLVGYTSSVVIIFQAANTLGASPEQISSWLWALGIGMAFTSIGLSIRFKTPVLTAWSTPGAALMVSSLAGLSMAEAIGSFLVCSALITLFGVAGWFNLFVRLIPRELASALLAGVLFAFGLDLFIAMQTNKILVIGMLLVYFIFKYKLPRYVILLTLIAGVLIAFFQGEFQQSPIVFELSVPIFTLPSFNWSAIVSVSIPLFIVTMASQNIPGYAAIVSHGYKINANPLMTWTGVTGLVLGPFGGYAYNLAAITAAICMSEEVDRNTKQRYRASVWAGIFYLISGLLGATVVSLFLIFPKELVMSIAGIALLNTIAQSLNSALQDKSAREPALITFLVTVSGVTVLGVGSAFWAVVIGLMAFKWSQHQRQKS